MTESAFRPARRNGGPVAGLLLLCFLWSLDSLRSDLFPQLKIGAQGFSMQAMAFAMAALAAALLGIMRGARRPRAAEALEATLVGLGMFVVPAVLIRVAGSWVGDSTRVALFALVPIVAVVFEPHIGRPNASQARGALMAALVAVAGTLCVFPVDLPRSIEAGSAFCAVAAAAVCIGITNCWAVRVAVALPAKSLAPFAAIATGMAALGFAVGAVFADRSGGNIGTPEPAAAWTVAVDLPALLLLFWLLRRMSAVRMATRFLLAPLMVNLVALVLFRPVVDLRAGFGLVSIASGAAWILLARESHSEIEPPSLNLDRV